MSEIATMPLPAMIGQPDVVSKPASSYNLPIGYLRAFIAVLVLTLTRCWRTSLRATGARLAGHAAPLVTGLSRGR
jgi:hypothetical protein